MGDFQTYFVNQGNICSRRFLRGTGVVQDLGHFFSLNKNRSFFELFAQALVFFKLVDFPDQRIFFGVLRPRFLGIMACSSSFSF